MFLVETVEEALPFAFVNLSCSHGNLSITLAGNCGLFAIACKRDKNSSGVLFLEAQHACRSENRASFIFVLNIHELTLQRRARCVLSHACREELRNRRSLHCRENTAELLLS